MQHRRTIALLSLFFLSACQVAPLPSHLMQANRKVYDQATPDAFLKHQLRVGDVTYGGGDDAMAQAFKEAKTALEDSLAIGGYLADEGKAHYRLSAIIRDAKFPTCFMGTCETGAAIDYTLTEIRDDKTVYNDLIVVPYTHDYSIFATDLATAQKDTLGGAIGENFAHLIHVLSSKKATDLQEVL